MAAKTDSGSRPAPRALAAAITAGLRDEVRIRPRVAFDVLGMAVFAAAISAFLVGLVEAGASEPWRRALGLALLGLSGVLLVLFVLVERRASEPVIPLRLFRNPIVRAAAITGLLSGMAMFGAITYVPLYLQAVVGSTATQAGSRRTSATAPTAANSHQNQAWG